MTFNLWSNANNSKGYHFFPGTTNVAIPNDCNLTFFNGVKDVGMDSNYEQPEIVIWRKEQAPTEQKQWVENGPTIIERDEFFTKRGYDKIIKAFGAWKPIRFELKQDINLGIGNNYRVTFPLFSDPVITMAGGGLKFLATDPKSVQARINILNRETGDVVSSDWYDGTVIKPLQYTDVKMEFIAKVVKVSIAIEFKGIHGLQSNGVFIGNPELIDLGVGTTISETSSVVPPTELDMLERLVESSLSDLSLANMLVDQVWSKLGMVKGKIQQLK